MAERVLEEYIVDIIIIILFRNKVSVLILYIY